MTVWFPTGRIKAANQLAVAQCRDPLLVLRLGPGQDRVLFHVRDLVRVRVLRLDLDPDLMPKNLE